MPGAESYLVYRSSRPDEPGAVVGRVSPTGFERESFTDRSQAAGVAAYYRAATRSKAEGESEPSDVVYAVPVVDRLWVEVRAGRGPWGDGVRDDIVAAHTSASEWTRGRPAVVRG